MKTRFVRLLMLPVAAFFLASAAAVTSSTAAESKTDRLTIVGYIHASTPTSCDPVTVDCEEQGNVLCMYGNQQVFDKDSPSTCLTALWRTE